MEARDDTVAAQDFETAPQGVGAMLRSRRIELGLSQAEVANMVKLPPRRIEAMEQERWDELPDGPYLRGFLRNIARALNLDPSLLLDRVNVTAPSTGHARPLVAPGSTHVALPRRSGPADDRRGGRALVYGALAFAFLAALIAWSGTESFDRAVTLGRGLFHPSRDVAGAKLPQTPATAGSESVAATTDASSTPSAAVSAETPAATAAETPSSTPTTAAQSELALLFHFNDRSWIEVRSADGKVLQRLNEAGSDLTVDGAAPFSLIVGNAKGVALRFRGQPVDLAPYTRDAVARFTLS